jgi:hypothetical protein
MNIDEMALLQNDCNKHVSPISKGFVKTRVNSNLAREKPNNTT